MLDDSALDILFRKARTQNGWQERAVTDAELRAVYDLAKWGPTSANCSPMRLQFVKSPAAKARLRPFLNPGNVEKTMAAPAIAIIGYDLAFYDHLPKLFPHNADARNWFAGAEKAAHATATAFRNGSLQGAYLMIAARALGLDCGPMSGFNAEGIDREFWSGTSVKTNFLCSLGHGDPAKVFARSPRFEFDEVAKIL
ncbi:MAG: malonic semialdehyde reductase [Burkholderiales bacterium]|jgi:3-hydroxypropanoate dehydrogenase|nr:malonic semialdehyde reductase [Burkholderiales bacterium]